MNPDPDKLRTLLEDVLPASSENSGPSCSEVLTMLRHQRQRQSRWRAGLAALVALASALFWLPKPTTKTPHVAQAPAKPQPIVIQTVNDEQLLALLAGTPAALMKRPDGTSELFIIEQ